MKNIKELTLGEIVKENYKAAAVLERFSLDFCCNGNRNFQDACKSANADPDQVIHQLRELETRSDDGLKFDTWSLNKLIDYILQRHHAYIGEKAPQIKGYLDKICRVHGERHPELLEVRTIFSEVAGEMTVHMKKEELMLFPFIRRMERAQNTGELVQSPLFKSVNFPVELMQTDHAEEGAKLARIAGLTNHYKIPSDACNSFEVTYQLLDEFEKDLHMHIHLENNILFPKAILLENKLSSGKSRQTSVL
jgi:regulator of cell morphogenesis and NO signaling